MSPANVIEVDEITAGIVISDHRRFRFFASEPAFHSLDGVLFRTADQATRAVRRFLTDKSRCERMADAQCDGSDQTTTKGCLSTRLGAGSGSPGLGQARPCVPAKTVRPTRAQLPVLPPTQAIPDRR